MTDFEIYLYVHVYAPGYMYSIKIIVSFATIKLMLKNLHVNLKMYVEVYRFPPVLLDTL